jgi:hypothetical protein
VTYRQIDAACESLRHRFGDSMTCTISIVQRAEERDNVLNLLLVQSRLFARVAIERRVCGARDRLSSGIMSAEQGLQRSEFAKLRYSAKRLRRSSRWLIKRAGSVLRQKRTSQRGRKS